MPATSDSFILGHVCFVAVCSIADGDPGCLQRWTSLVLLVGLLMSLYAGLIQSYAQRSQLPEDVKRAYLYILRIMGCLLLLSCANVLKTLIAKILSCHFYCSGYFDKMQDALRKVADRHYKLNNAAQCMWIAFLLLAYPCRCQTMGYDHLACQGVRFMAACHKGCCSEHLDQLKDGCRSIS